MALRQCVLRNLPGHMAANPEATTRLMLEHFSTSHSQVRRDQAMSYHPFTEN